MVTQGGPASEPPNKGPTEVQSAKQIIRSTGAVVGFVPGGFAASEGR